MALLQLSVCRRIAEQNQIARLNFQNQKFN